MLARMIMYFCGDPESWDQRSLMIGMMGGMGGGMGGMGGGWAAVWAAAWVAWAAVCGPFHPPACRLPRLPRAKVGTCRPGWLASRRLISKKA